MGLFDDLLGVVNEFKDEASAVTKEVKDAVGEAVQGATDIKEGAVGKLSEPLEKLKNITKTDSQN